MAEALSLPQNLTLASLQSWANSIREGRIEYNQPLLVLGSHVDAMIRRYEEKTGDNSVATDFLTRRLIAGHGDPYYSEVRSDPDDDPMRPRGNPIAIATYAGMLDLVTREKPAVVVAVARSGLGVGAIAQSLGLPAAILETHINSSTPDSQLPDDLLTFEYTGSDYTGHVTEVDMPIMLRGRGKVVLVDSVARSGRTLELARRHLLIRGADEVKIAVASAGSLSNCRQVQQRLPDLEIVSAIAQLNYGKDPAAVREILERGLRRLELAS